MAEDLEQLLAEGSEIAAIGYHINDDFANVYSNARAEYYGMVGLPHVVIDGSQSFDVSYEAMLERYDIQIDIPSNYSLNINAERYGTSVNATVNVGQIAAPNPETKVLHFLLTESHIPKSWYGGDEVNHAERLMVPDQYGTPIFSGGSILSSFDFEFDMDPSWLVQNCEIIAFLQDTVTKEIIQAQVFPLESTVLYNDVKLSDILNPNDGYCSENISPVIVLENYGADILTSCLVTYEINGEINEFSWEGVLYTYQSEAVILPEITFVMEDNNSVLVNLSLPNGEDDENEDDNSIENSFDFSQIISNQNLILELKTDNFGSETSWELLNSIGEVVYNGDSYADTTLYLIDLQLLTDDCYTFVLNDAGGNGICCANGFGYYRIKDINGFIYFVGGSFGEMDIATFQIDLETNISAISSLNESSIFPNPISDLVQIKSNAVIYKVVIIDTQGNLIFKDENVGTENLNLDLSHFRSGVYFIRLETANGWFIHKAIKI